MNDNDNITKIVVADSSAIIRAGLVAVLRRLPDMNVQAVEVQSQESLRSYMVTHAPDIVIVNPMFDGVMDIRALRADNRDLDTRYIALASTVIDNNALKDYHDHIGVYDSIDTIAEKIKGQLADATADDDSDRENLSDREKEIVVYIVKGLTNKEIADKLCLSIHTVITHRRNISRKLQIHSSAGLTIYAIVNKLVDIHDVNDLL